MEQLKCTLEKAGIDITRWGIGQAKTLAHLKKEIENGETFLVSDEAGKLIRTVVVGGADIFYQSPDGKKFHLREDRQVFNDGRMRQRNLSQSVSEKIKPGEDPDTAVIRGIQEELGIEGEIVSIRVGTDDQIIESPSYPGLQSQYVIHRYQVTLTEKQFDPRGYVENQPDKNTYFVWEKLEG